MEEERMKDILLMTIAIHLSIIGTEPTDGSLSPLFFVGVLITSIVVVKEFARRFAEYSSR